MNLTPLLKSLSIPTTHLEGNDIPVFSPIDGEQLGIVSSDNKEETNKKIDQSEKAFFQWRTVPAPKRGELIRLFGEELRHSKEALGQLVSIEMGKSLQEGRGEVQEMIDICEFAVGLSRQLYGLTIASERPEHRMLETWHPLGPVGVISAFNFPVAVFSWNFALAVVCGNSVIWKPSEKTPITAIAVVALFHRALEKLPEAPKGLLQLVIGDRSAGEQLVKDQRIPLVSATGSTDMGRKVAPVVAERFGRCILELGGNNGMIVSPKADLQLAIRATVFSAVGTAGQRCTSLRRVFVHNDIYNTFITALKSAYEKIAVGNPLDENNLLGPLIDKDAYITMQKALTEAENNGARVTGGSRILTETYRNAYYVTPALVEIQNQEIIVKQETFAPILYIMKYQDLDAAIAQHNDVSQGLSSCIFTNDLREAERFLSAAGSDCGIANVNIGPSGAEIGGAFGGEKETGGGRESGSDAWKSYMRRATNTINYSTELPLAQGIKFEL
ncbi:MAG: aldehyde dehydrogenase family protein [Rhodospirillales bacterium]|nr:aldehyde dehydrogenase family protein [Rhodospirillales bacterium]